MTGFGAAFAGGVLIGLGSLLAVLATGKIPGISGVLSRALWPRRGDTLWRVLFLIGLVAGAGIAFRALGGSASYRPVASLGVVALAGLLVGFGTRLGGGCTSGHGVCGVGLLSRSAIVATLVFMTAGMATVFLVRVAGLAAQ